MAINWGKLGQIAKAVVRAERSIENVSTPKPKRINVCKEIKCPYAYKTSPNCSSGCRKYSVASHCHLVQTYPDLKKEATEYFLHSEANLVNISGLKAENDSFFLQNSWNRQSLEFDVECGNQTLYAPYSDETFDLSAYLNQ